VNALAMDASTSIVSCSLSWEGGWSQSSSRSAVGHAERLMPMIDALLSGAGVAPSSLGLVVCASGPGSFTGLRIALSTAKGICAATGAALVLVPTLDYLASGHPSRSAVMPVIDGKKGRIYAALYRAGVMDGPVLDLPAQEIASRLPAEEEISFTGPDADLMADFAAERPAWSIDPWHSRPRPEALLALGVARYRSGETAGPGEGPFYVRNDEEDIGITFPGRKK